jgi:chromosome segregation ATPase
MSIQNINKQKFSRLRQGIVQLANEIKKLTNPFLSDLPVIKGSVYELKRKCGKAGCKCAQGELHCRMVVSSSEKGKTRLRVIPSGFFAEVQGKVGRYQELRQARARLVEVHKKMLQVIDEMEAMRREEVPSSDKNSTGA